MLQAAFWLPPMAWNDPVVWLKWSLPRPLHLRPRPNRRPSDADGPPPTTVPNDAEHDSVPCGARRLGLRGNGVLHRLLVEPLRIRAPLPRFGVDSAGPPEPCLRGRVIGDLKPIRGTAESPDVPRWCRWPSSALRPACAIRGVLMPKTWLGERCEQRAEPQPAHRCRSIARGHDRPVLQWPRHEANDGWTTVGETKPWRPTPAGSAHQDRLEPRC